MLFKKRYTSGSVGCIAAVVVAYTLSTVTVSQAEPATAPAAEAAGAPAAAGAPGAPPSTGPIDIEADSQDFAGDVVIAHGNVKVKFKDSTILAPDAQLFKDPSGQPQMAIFTGHPHLIQKKNKIDADKLTFMMAVNKIIADGNAHSEVSGDANDAPEGEDAAPEPVKVATTAPPPVTAPKKKVEGAGWQDDEAEAPAAVPAAAAAPADAPKGPAKAAEKIFVDSEHQEYESETGHFVAMGHCKVKHGEILVDSNTLNLVYGADGRPETALFGGSVNATQNGNNTKAEHMTYSLLTQRLQAAGNVRSKVVNQKPATSELKKGAQASLSKTSDAKIKIRQADGTIKELSKAEADKYGIRSEEDKKKNKTFELKMDSDEPIYVISDSQDYIKESGKMTALGNVHVYYNDNKGLGNKMIMIRNDEGKADKMIFTGRSQIVQPGKRWIGDRITFLVPTERVVAEGNTRAIILNTTAQVKPKVDANGEAAPNADASVDSQVDAQVVKDPAMTDSEPDNQQIGTKEVTPAQ